MSGIVPTLANALRRLTAEQMLLLLAELTRGQEISVALNVPPDGFVLVPRDITPAMIQAIRYHQWTESSYQWQLKLLWEKLLKEAS